MCWPMVPNGSGLCVRVMVHVCVGLGWGGELNSFSCNAHYAIFDRACTRVGNVGHDRQGNVCTMWRWICIVLTCGWVPGNDRIDE